MVNTLQFVIFMDNWKVNWPPNASVAIKSIRSIALGEFIDTKALANKALDYYGLNQPKLEEPVGRFLEVA